MPENPFVHLHCHTDYSMLDGASEIGQLMDTVVSRNLPAAAMTLPRAIHGGQFEHPVIKGIGFDRSAVHALTSLFA